MSKITYPTKYKTVPETVHAEQWWAEDANEVKAIVNENDTVENEQTHIVKFDRIQGREYGSWGLPIQGNIVLDPSNQVNGGCCVVLWRGAVNPTFTGGTINYISGEITADGVYSVYIHYLQGLYNVNIFDADKTGTPPVVPEATAPTITVTEPTGPAATSPTITVT